MTRVSGALAVGAAFVGGVLALALPDGEARAWWFRVVVLIVAVLSLRELVRWLERQPRARSAAPFHRPWFTRRRPVVLTARRTESVLHLAEFSAGDVHRTLRPLAQEIADERLRASHGMELTDPRAEALVSPVTWELIRSDRPTPHDLRSAGLSPDAIDALITDLEAL